MPELRLLRRGRSGKRSLSCSLLRLLMLFAWVGAGAGVDSGGGERGVLLGIRGGFADGAGVLAGWGAAGRHHCDWEGVGCDAGSRVVEVNVTGGFAGLDCWGYGGVGFFAGAGAGRGCGGGGGVGVLGGKLSPLVAELRGLRVLSLPFNGIEGEVPAGVWDLPELEILDLAGNLLSGALPSEIRGLRKLQVLDLGFNKLVGEIPSSLLSCASLEVLNLSGNQLNGTIPLFMGGFPRLRGLYLSMNKLDGVIPDELGVNCTRTLEHLDLSGNLLVEAIPGSLGNCVGLRSLLLFSNMLENAIPSVLGRLLNLQVLDVSRNTLSGSIPSELGNCAQLSVFVLSNLLNPLPGTGAYSDVSSSRANDDYNCFKGGIPSNITALPKLKILWVPRANLEGQLPNDWGVCGSLEMVNLGQNYFSGELAGTFGRCKNLRFLDLSSNKFTGELDVDLPVPCMTFFDASGNRLSGKIPRFVHVVCPTVPLEDLSNGDPEDLSLVYSSFFTYRSSVALSLPSFGLAGTVPIFHNFGGNNFTDPLPPLPVASERLVKRVDYAFLVDRNQLVGSLPGYIFDICRYLNGLIANFSSNKISGQIPVDIGMKCRSLKLLDVSRNEISGVIPQNFGDLENLAVLNMSINMLIGQIPESLAKLKYLKHLSLAGNNLTGVIPSGLSQLPSLEVLDLSTNSLSGKIPGSLANIRNLSVLLLNHNRLSGQIPSGFGNVTSLSHFNMSFNNLSGPLPTNANSTICNSVVGNPFLNSCPIHSLTVPPSDVRGQGGVSLQSAESSSDSASGKKSNSGFNSIEIATITSAAAIVSVLLALIFLFLYTRKCIPKHVVHGTGPREVTVFIDIGVPLTFDIVMRATGNFNASNCIGSGGFGATYKAEVAAGVLVAVKRLSVGRFQGVQQFQAEIKTLGRMRHPNLVKLIGFHASETEMFLIYNYLPGGNLENFIQERSKRPVDWWMLHKIALDVARALAYLHDQCVPRVLHRDVKPSNILLDNEYNAHLSDFGLARLLGTSETHATTGVAGTFGYVAPEYAMTCRVSDKADVYSYGVVLLELISDKKALDPSFSSYGNGFNIVAWACMLLRQGRAREVFAAGLWDIGPHDDLVETLHLAVMCTVDSLSIRPTMKQVVQRLKQLQPPTC